MKNLETIRNVGEDAANYIKTEKTAHFLVVGPTLVRPPKKTLKETKANLRY